MRGFRQRFQLKPPLPCRMRSAGTYLLIPSSPNGSGAPLRLLALAPRLLETDLRQVALQLVEIVGERDAVVEFETGYSLVVKLEDAFAQVGPEHKPLTREPDDAGALVLGIGNPFDKPVTLEAL